jgi:hypothetical protein
MNPGRGFAEVASFQEKQQDSHATTVPVAGFGGMVWAPSPELGRLTLAEVRPRELPTKKRPYPIFGMG